VDSTCQLVECLPLCNRLRAGRCLPPNAWINAGWIQDNPVSAQTYNAPGVPFLGGVLRSAAKVPSQAPVQTPLTSISVRWS